MTYRLPSDVDRRPIAIVGAGTLGRRIATVYVSGGSDVRQHRGIDLFCDNLRAYLDGRPVANVIDWANGY